MKLPSGRYVSIRTPIYLGSNFTWGEATKNCSRPIQDLVIDGRLFATALSIEKVIVSTAQKLDELRAKLNNRPIWVNSWYRPPNTNSRIGGSKYSRHQFGDAVDIRSDYFTPGHIYSFIEKGHYNGGLGKYPTFVHIDWRGFKARW